MEKSSFFNSVSHDRTYKAEDWAEYFASFIGNGVFPVPSTGLQVVANDGMKLNVKTGKAWINGYFYFNTGDLAVELDTADGQLNRIDRVVVRWDLTNRVMSVKVKSSSFSASPTAPAVQRDADVYELALADIYVGAGVTAITQSKITDQRLNTSLCGVVAAVVQQIDTAAFNAQLQAWFAEYQSLSAAEYNTLVSYMNSLKLQGNTQYEAFEQHMADFETQAAADFNAWFNGLQTVLDDNAATNLLNITNALDARVDMLEAVLFNDITTNPFLILFDDLDGVTSTGIWNEDAFVNVHRFILYPVYKREAVFLRVALCRIRDREGVLYKVFRFHNHVEFRRFFELLFFIELSQEMGFISMSSCEYWSKLALEVKYMTTAWKKRDKTRA